jgi:hypothetical protein
MFEEIESLTVRDVVWLDRELRRLLGRDDEPDAAVREPRRPIRPHLGAGELLGAYEIDATGAHTASAISVAPSADICPADVDLRW